MGKERNIVVKTDSLALSTKSYSNLNTSKIKEDSSQNYKQIRNNMKICLQNFKN